MRRRVTVAIGGSSSKVAAYLSPISPTGGDLGIFKIQQQSQRQASTKVNALSSKISFISNDRFVTVSFDKDYVRRNTIPIKFLSTQAEASTASVQSDGIQLNAEPTMIQPSIVHSPDGRKFAAFELPTFQRKLKPYIVKRRLARMKTFVGKQKNIRHSPWRMNLVCQFAAGQTLTDAIQQLEFCRKSMAPLVKKVLIRTANVADMKYGLQQSQLEVAECFATKGTPLKRLRIMGRGRTGRMEHKHSHFRVVLREIDFKLRIYQAPTIGQKKRWFLRQQQAEADFARAKAERDEISRLEKETEAYRKKESSK